jgi:hypothetical protein
MLLPALLLAAALQAAPPIVIAPSGPSDLGGATTFGRSIEEVRATVKARAACQASGLELAVNAGSTTGEAKRLGDLPPANHTLTVLRSVDGCPVSSTVRFNVDRPAGR